MGRRIYHAVSIVSSFAFCGWPSLAFAHAAFSGAGDFYAGVLHPITSPEHIMLLSALGLLVGQNGRQRCSFLLAVFPAAVLFGALISQCWQSPRDMYIFTFSAVIASGIFLVMGRQLSNIVLGLFTAILGITFGLTNGSAIEGQMLPAAFFSGVVAVAFLALAYLMAIVDGLINLRQGWIKIGLRVAGSWIIAISLLVLSLAGRQWMQGYP